jgi:hypothetical protein
MVTITDRARDPLEMRKTKMCLILLVFMEADLDVDHGGVFVECRVELRP